MIEDFFGYLGRFLGKYCINVRDYVQVFTILCEFV